MCVFIVYVWCMCVCVYVWCMRVCVYMKACVCVNVSVVHVCSVCLCVRVRVYVRMCVCVAYVCVPPTWAHGFRLCVWESVYVCVYEYV